MSARTMRALEKAAMEWHEVHAAAEEGYALRPEGEVGSSYYDLLEVKLARACALHAARKKERK